MKTRLLLATLALLLAPALHAITVREGIEITDFPNSAAAVTAAETYTLTSGSNTFSGTIPGLSIDADYFKITVAPGKQVTQITTNGALGISVPTAPLDAGTYTISCAPPTGFGNVNWTITFTVATAPDYRVNSSGGFLSVTDIAGNGDTLTVSQAGAGFIKFAALGRTFSVNGGALITGDSGNVPLAGVTDIDIEAGAGNDTINVGFFSTPMPGLTINGGAGDDTVNLNGDITFAVNQSLDVEGGSSGADTVNVAAGANLSASGTGAITVICSRNVSLGTGASLGTVNGVLDVDANQQAAATTGNFIGVNLDGAMLRTTGSGVVTVKGRGGNDAGGFQLGVQVINGAKITGGNSGSVNVTGTGGASTNVINRGVTVSGAGSAITSTGAPVNVTGTGGALSSSYGIGVSVLNGEISAGGTGAVSITGTGARAVGGGFNTGIELDGAATRVTSAGANVILTGRAGTGASFGISMAASAVVSTPAAGGNVTLEADSISLDGTSSVSTLAAASSATLQTHTTGTRIDLGGADDNASAPKVLGLTDAELDRVTTPNLIISSGSNATLTISAPISPAGAANLTLAADATTGSIRPTFAGTDVTLSGVLKLGGPLACPIAGTVPDTDYPQLKVVGGVNLNGVALDLTGATLPGAAGQTFTVVDNDGADPITGTFAGGPEGAYFPWPGSPAFYARISYIGGSGNDAVLTLVPASQALIVTTSSDTGPGSLRDLVAFAAVHPGADTITFAPALSGQTILLASEIAIGDAAGVTVDASNLPAGVTINGGGASGTFALLNVTGGSNVTLRSLTLANGGGSGFTGSGGAIRNDGTLVLEGCTLFGNAAISGGAIANGKTLTLTQCTLTGNSSTGAGGTAGAIHSDTTLAGGSLTLTHCTCAGNISAAGGSAIICDGIFAMNNTIAAGNTNGNLGGSGSPSGSHNLTGGDPLLAPLGSYGGPTPTMALLPGSPARNAAVGSTVTGDQRGFPIVGTPDIGAYEAGTFTNYNAWIYETLPASTALNAAQHASTFDFDGDGVSNVNEWLALTDPGNVASVLRITQSARSGNTLSVTFPSIAARHYTLESTTNLATGLWTFIPGSAATGTGSPITMPISPVNGFMQYFVRVRVGP